MLCCLITWTECLIGLHTFHMPGCCLPYHNADCLSASPTRLPGLSLPATSEKRHNVPVHGSPFDYVLCLVFVVFSVWQWSIHSILYLHFSSLFAFSCNFLVLPRWHVSCLFLFLTPGRFLFVKYCYRRTGISQRVFLDAFLS